MRFLSMVRTDESTGRRPSERLMNDMREFMEELAREGKLIRTAGLRPSAEGFRVRMHDGKISTVDGPFTESKEVIGGYVVLEVSSRAEAIELTERFLRIHEDDWEIECEVRPLDGMEFGAEG